MTSIGEEAFTSCRFTGSLIIGESKLINIEKNIMVWIVPVTFQTNLNFYFEAGAAEVTASTHKRGI